MRLGHSEEKPDTSMITKVKPKLARYKLTELKLRKYDMCPKLESNTGRGIVIYK